MRALAMSILAFSACGGGERSPEPSTTLGPLDTALRERWEAACRAPPTMTSAWEHQAPHAPLRFKDRDVRYVECATDAGSLVLTWDVKSGWVTGVFLRGDAPNAAAFAARIEPLLVSVISSAEFRRIESLLIEISTTEGGVENLYSKDGSFTAWLYWEQNYERTRAPMAFAVGIEPNTPPPRDRR